LEDKFPKEKRGSRTDWTQGDEERRGDDKYS
jgi:hypothetical protein